MTARLPVVRGNLITDMLKSLLTESWHMHQRRTVFIPVHRLHLVELKRVCCSEDPQVPPKVFRSQLSANGVEYHAHGDALLFVI
jgi:hypothetical protein